MSGNIEEELRLARRALKAGQTDRALKGYRKILALEPTHVEALSGLGHAALDQRDLRTAELCFRRIVTAYPKLAKGHFHVGNLENARGNLPQAEAAYRRSIDLDPDSPLVHNNLGHVLQFLGRFGEAYTEFETALALKPDLILPLANLLSAKDYEAKPQLIDHAEKLAASGHGKLQDRSRLHHALGKRHDFNKDFGKAFAHIEAANRIKQSLVPFDRDDFETQVETITGYFSKDYLTGTRDLGDPTTRPLFILGMPRSGSTLAEQILSMHPQVHPAGELHLIGLMVRDMSKFLGATGPYPQCLEGLSADNAGALAADFMKRLPAEAMGATRVIDKTPLNFLHIGLIALIFPNARVVHCKRHPLDLCLSCYFESFEKSQSWATDLQAMATFYRGYERLMDHWHAVAPLPILDLKYEHVIEDLEREARRLVEFCGLPWDDRCLGFHKHERPIKTASQWQARQPLYATSVGRWKAYEAFLTPLKETLGL